MKKRGLSINKKGQDLSIGTLILIVLGIVVLVVLILGFSLGWSNLFSKIGITTGSDLSAMVAACKVAAASESQASFWRVSSVRILDLVNFRYWLGEQLSPDSLGASQSAPRDGGRSRAVSDCDEQR